MGPGVSGARHTTIGHLNTRFSLKGRLWEQQAVLPGNQGLFSLHAREACLDQLGFNKSRLSEGSNKKMSKTLMADWFS